MEETKFLFLVGLIYIAPHMNKDAAIFLGLISLVVAAFTEMFT